MSYANTERRRLLQRLMKKLSNGDFAGMYEDYLVTASKYTGLHPKVLRELESCDVFETRLQPIDRSVIYDKLVYFYLNRSKIPTTFDLFTALHGEIPSYIDIGNFRKILVKMDFVWKKTSPTTAVIIENPLVRFERYNYLKRMQFYRSSKSDIYYIDINMYDSSGGYRDHKLAKELLSRPLIGGWVQRVIYALGPQGIHALEDITDFSDSDVEQWVKDCLLPSMTKPSVFLLKNDAPYNGKLLETPTLESFKTDIIRWLEKHGITYDPKMSKYELFALAEKYTDLNTNLYKIDLMLKAKGHAVLRIPKCIENGTSAALLSRVLMETFQQTIENSEINPAVETENLKSLFRELIMSSAATYIDEFERYIREKEDVMVEMDDKVDKIYEDLLNRAGGKVKDNYADSDIPSCSDSE